MSSDFPEDNSAELPARRDDEPESLRQDILDELSDHLQCAMNRELHRYGDSFKAQQQVLARFGNPAATAARLWRDAMWEKIMTMRLTLTCTVLAVVLSIAAVGYAWRSSTQSQELMQTLVATIADQKTHSQQIIDEMRKANARPQEQPAPVNIEWNPVELRFVEGTEDGPPVQGVQVTLSMKSPPSSFPMTEISDSDGVVRFRTVHHGMYHIAIHRNDLHATLSKYQEISIPAGEMLRKTIVCPRPLKPEPRTLVEMQWPEDLISEDLVWGFSSESLFLAGLPGRETWVIQLRQPATTTHFHSNTGAPLTSRQVIEMSLGLDSASLQRFASGNTGALLFSQDRTWNLSFDWQLPDSPTRRMRELQPLHSDQIAFLTSPPSSRAWRMTPGRSRRLNWPDAECRFFSGVIFIPDVSQQGELVAKDLTGSAAFNILPPDAAQHFPVITKTSIIRNDQLFEPVDSAAMSSDGSNGNSVDTQWRLGLAQRFYLNIADQQFIRGEPNRLKVTPSAEMVDWIRTAIKARNEDAAKIPTGNQDASASR